MNNFINQIIEADFDTAFEVLFQLTTFMPELTRLRDAEPEAARREGLNKILECVEHTVGNLERVHDLFDQDGDVIPKDVRDAMVHVCPDNVRCFDAEGRLTIEGTRTLLLTCILETARQRRAAAALNVNKLDVTVH